MPMIEFSDEQVQQLTLVLANASGPGISWMMTNGLLATLQAQTQAKPISVPAKKPRHVPPGDGLDLNPPQEN